MSLAYKRTRTFAECYAEGPLILTEGAVGLRLEREFGIKPDADIVYAGLIYDDGARRAMETLYGQYLEVARRYKLPILLFTNTRRADSQRLERSPYRGRDIMGDYTRFLRGLIERYDCEAYVGGMLGCKNDAYTGRCGLSCEEAADYHSWQIDAFGKAQPDFLYAALLPTVPEAIGIARAISMQWASPYILSLMVNRSGRLPGGAAIHDAIARIDSAVPRRPLCYMSNCVHPRVLHAALERPFNDTPLVRARFRGLQANAADMEAAALDGSAVLHTSDADEWADAFGALNAAFPLKIRGGCCGTDNAHIEALARRMI